MKRILVTGAFGLVGTELVEALQKEEGVTEVVALSRETTRADFQGTLAKGDVRDKEGLAKLIKEYQIDYIVHLAGLLSVGGEKQPDLAWEVNVGGLKNVLDLAVEHGCQVFWPSSIAAFGPTTPRENTPQHTVLEPTTIYGVSKVTGEMLCNYYHERYGLDTRGLRYPGLNGWKADPGDGTTEYAIHIFYAALKEGRYTVPLKPDTRLPMMYMDDAIAGTIQLMKAPAEKLSTHMSYNFGAVNFTPAELVAEIRALQPAFEVEYQPDARQQIAESWPTSIDDSLARQDWGWQHQFDLKKMAEALYEGVQQKLSEKE